MIDSSLLALLLALVVAAFVIWEKQRKEKQREEDLREKERHAHERRKEKQREKERREKERHAREFEDWLRAMKALLVHEAGGEYINFSKAKRMLQTPHAMPDSSMGVAESPGSYTTNSAPAEHDLTNHANKYLLDNSEFIDKLDKKFVEQRLVKSEALFGGLHLTSAKRLAIVRAKDANLINAGAVSGKIRTNRDKGKSLIVRRLNAEFVKRQLAESKEFFDGLALTEKQRIAVVRDEDANLINAGAGSGKTRTIQSKVKYLIAHGLAEPSEILVVVYNKTMANAIVEKIAQVSPDVAVRTFHALGLEILRQTNNRPIPVIPLAADPVALKRFLSQEMTQIFQSPLLHKALIRFFSAHLVEGDPEQGCKTLDEYLQKIRYVEMRSLDGQKLKSHQEVEIANWLILNGVCYEYERPYPHHDGPKQHCPDFYLPDYDLWIEHFGIDENGDTAPWVDCEKCHQVIKWKREQHRKHYTTLVETYSYDARKAGGLAGALETKLAEKGVQKKPLSESDIDCLVEKSFQPQSGFIGLVARFLNLCRENKLDKQTLRNRAKSERDRLFLKLFEFFRYRYEAELQAKGEIDFADMIVRGMECVKSGRYQSKFKYILVDEYQDITQVRLDFLLALQQQVKDARLFCVGDDWQSIYQFAGANVGLIANFDEYVDAMARTDLDKTFRFPQKISDFSQVFITKNPNQLKKTVDSDIADDNKHPIHIIYHAPKEQREKIVAIIDKISSQNPPATSCFVLGRYNQDHPKKEDWEAIRAHAKSKGVGVAFSTIHKSKGLEADWVIVVENKSGAGGYGFPSGVQTDPVLRMGLPEDEFRHAEERRLFYVAVTRAKRGVFLLAPQGEASEFIREIDPRIGGVDYAPFVKVVNGKANKILICPQCRGQTIRKTKTSNGGFFYACTHFPACKGKLPYCESCGDAIALANQQASTCKCDCGEEYEVCSKCRSGIMLQRVSEFGEFRSCSQYPECDFKKN